MYVFINALSRLSLCICPISKQFLVCHYNIDPVSALFREIHVYNWRNALGSAVDKYLNSVPEVKL